MTGKNSARKQQNATDSEKRPGTKRARVLRDLLLGNTIRQAARNAGIDHTTIYRWLKDPAFAQALATARRDSFFLAKDLLKVLSENAVAILARTMESKDESQARQAAVAILDRAMKIEEREDFEARLQELERIVGVRPLPIRAATEPDREPS